MLMIHRNFVNFDRFTGKTLFCENSAAKRFVKKRKFVFDISDAILTSSCPPVALAFGLGFVIISSVALSLFPLPGAVQTGVNTIMNAATFLLIVKMRVSQVRNVQELQSKLDALTQATKDGQGALLPPDENLAPQLSLPAARMPFWVAEWPLRLRKKLRRETAAA